MASQNKITDTKSTTPNWHWSAWASWVVLALALAITLAVWKESSKIAENLLRSQFHALIGETRNKLDDRIVAYTQVLRSAAALFAVSSSTVSRGQWRQFIEAQELGRNYPAITSVAFARLVRDAELDKFVQEMKLSGVKDFAVRPPGKRERYVVNAYAEPFTGGNIKALGYDMWQDADRRITMERAAASGQPMITQCLTLKIDEKTDPVPAFIMYLPVRIGGEVYGYVLSPFRMPTLLQDLLGRKADLITLDIYDGTEPAADKLFYRSDNGADTYTPRLTERQTLEIGGRKWTLEFSTRARLENRTDRNQPRLVLAIGLAFSILLFVIAWSLVRTRARAEAIAEEKTRSLSKSQNLLRVQIEELQTSQKLLKDSEQKHQKLSNEQRIILNSSSVGIIFVKKRKVLWANPAHCTMFGYEVGATQNLDTAVYYINNESYEYVGEKGYSTMASGGIFSEDLMMKKRDGSLIWCNLVGQAVDPQHMEEGSIWIIQDITERKRAEEERLQLEQQFHHAQKLESLGVLAGGIAHDFNNILTVIIGHCYMAREDFIPEEEYKSVFQKIETASNRAAELCRQMLTYAGKSPMEQERVNLWLLLDEVVKMLKAAIKKNVTIELDLKRDVPEINGDIGQIQQIIMNLIINAAEAIGEANGTIKVVLTTTIIGEDQTVPATFGTAIKAGRYVCLEVTDTGCGMDEETRKRIFEPFFTTKSTGRGLGMSAIHGIIKSHEGAMQLTSAPGVGTTFKVYFPVPEVSDYAKTASTATVPLEEVSGAILLVDDEETLRNMGIVLLEAMGFTATTAQHGSEALEIYRERGNEIDVILLDLIMPVMGGIETYHELRKISPTVPIIICSGYGVESVEDVITNDPNAGFVHKPYKPDELRDVLVRMMKSEEEI